MWAQMVVTGRPGVGVPAPRESLGPVEVMPATTCPRGASAAALAAHSEAHLLLSGSCSKPPWGGGGLLISHPGHLPISAKPQPAGSKSDFLSREAASSLARLQLEMLRIGGEGGGGSPPPPPTSEHPRLEMSRPPGRLHFPGGTPGAGLSGPALSSPESPTIRRSPPGSAPCPGRPALPPPTPGDASAAAGAARRAWSALCARTL